GTARLTARSFSSRVFQPSGSGPAKGSAITRYAATAPATTAAPSPIRVLRPSRTPFPPEPGTGTCTTWVGGGGAGGFAAASSRARTRAAFGRRDGSLSSSAVMTSASGPWAVAGAAGVALRTDWSVAGVLLRRNGDTPSVAAYSTTPSDHRSEAGPGRWPSTRSGAMYSGEPTKPPVSV